MKANANKYATDIKVQDNEEIYSKTMALTSYTSIAPPAAQRQPVGESPGCEGVSKPKNKKPKHHLVEAVLQPVAEKTEP